MNTFLKDKLYSPVFPIIVTVIISYILSSIFLSVYSFAANAILHAFLADEEIGGGRQPDSLKKFIDVNDKYNEGKNKGKVSKNEDGRADDKGKKAEGPSDDK
jgi:hypothetical protein